MAVAIPGTKVKTFSTGFKKEMPNPDKSEIESKLFSAIWNLIKDWDINVPEYYSGYCGGNGSHVKLKPAIREEKIDSVLDI